MIYPHILVASVRPKRHLKRRNSQLNFNICCPINNEIVVAKNLQQIRADEGEIRRRIDCFVNRKRDEINNYNVQDFIHAQALKENDGNDNDNGMTCARVNSTVYRTEGSKGHLKVHRVKNETGPQTTNYKNALDKLMQNMSPVEIKPDPDSTTTLPLNVQERLTNAESHLNIPTTTTDRPATKSIFERLKAIEDKILYLEALSPEYAHFLVNTKTTSITSLLWTL